MSINNSLLVSADVLQEPLVDKVGNLLSNGTLYVYSNTNRLIPKNWYYQSGTGANPVYSTLPNNPMTLSASGTIVDVNGEDVVPLFYPYSETDNTTPETYFIRAYDQFGTLVFTRYNFPYTNNTTPSPTTSANTLQNYIVNNRFWRNVGTVTVPTSGSGTYSVTLAPSQHDGFSMPDIMYFKNVYGATETITFTPFAQSSTPILTNDVTPEFYINHQSTLQAGETLKYYQFPVSFHVQTLSGVQVSVSIQAYDASGTGTGYLNLYIYPFLGTGVTTATPVPFKTINLTNSWQKYTVTTIIPPTSTDLLSQTGDDAVYLWVGVPVSQACNINFTLPSLYIGNTIPVNSFATYDQIDSVISSPRTGDIRTSMNSFYPFGWIPMNDGLIGLTNPGTNTQYTRANSDTWPLFNLLWNMGKSYDSGSTFNPLFQMYSNTAGTLAAANFGASAYADFIATSPSMAIQLPHSMGQVMLGTVPISALLSATSSFKGYKSTVTASSSTGLLWTSGTNLLNLFLGNTVTFTSTAALTNVTANTVYYIVPVSSTSFKLATSFANALSGTVVAYTGAETGTVTAYIQLNGSGEGEYAHTQLAAEIASHTHAFAVPTYQTASTSAVPASSANTTFSGNYNGTTSANTPNGSPMNVTQPGVFYNIYIKL